MYGSELITLFGDELSEIDPGRAGVRVVGGEKVSARDMATMLLAVSVAELLDQNAAALTEQEVKKLFRTVRTLTVRSAESAGAGQGFTHAVAVAAREPVAVKQLALRLLGGRVVSPEMKLIAMAYAYLEPSGAVGPTNGKGKRVSSMLGMSPGEIDDQRAEILRDDWQRLRKVWETWKANNPTLADELVDQCRKAMTEAKDLSD